MHAQTEPRHTSAFSLQRDPYTLGGPSCPGRSLPPLWSQQKRSSPRTAATDLPAPAWPLGLECLWAPGKILDSELTCKWWVGCCLAGWPACQGAPNGAAQSPPKPEQGPYPTTFFLPFLPSYPRHRAFLSKLPPAMPMAPTPPRQGAALEPACEEGAH